MIAVVALGYRAVERRRRIHAPIRSVVVLPLENLSGDPSQQYLADGLTEALTTELAHINSLRVISRTSAIHYQGSHKALSEIARELDVDAVVEGSFVRSGNRIRIDAQLIQASADEHLWAASYERDLGDIVGLEGDVAQALRSEIETRLNNRPQPSKTIRAVNPAAYEAYLRGRFYWNKRTVEGLKTAKTCFEEAIAHDPNYALAYAGLADVYDVLGSGVAAALPPLEAAPKAREYAAKAIQLDDNLGEAHTSSGGIKFSFDWDWLGAEKEFQRAIELNPNDVTAHFWYAQLLLVMVRWDDAFAQADWAAHLDPVAPEIVEFRGALFHNMRQYDKAVERLQQALALDPNYFLVHYDLGRAYEQMGRYPSAIAEFQKALEMSGGDLTTRASLAHVYAVSGQKVEAEKILKELQRTKGSNLSYQIADIYLGLGQKDEAFRWLEQAYKDRSGWLTWISVEPKLDPVRSDPRFIDLHRRMRFPNT